MDTVSLAIVVVVLLLLLLGSGLWVARAGTARRGVRRQCGPSGGGGNRNMGLLLAVLPSDIDPDVLLYFALGQIPIYVMPALLTPLYRRLLPVHTA